MADEYHEPGEPFEWVFDASETGLTIGVRIVDNDGATPLARSTAIVTELGAGLYKAEIPGSLSTIGTYTIVADKHATSVALASLPPADIVAAASLEITYAIPASGSATPDDRDLCTLDDVVSYVPAYHVGDDSATDAKLQHLVTAQSGLFLTECGREIVPVEGTQPAVRTFPIGRIEAVLQRVRIGDLASLTGVRLLDADGTLVEDVDLDTVVPLYGEDRQPAQEWEPITQLDFPAGFTNRSSLTCGQVLEVTGTWGFPHIPRFVREAVAARVILRYVNDVAGAGTAFSDALENLNAAAMFRAADDALEAINGNGGFIIA